MDKNKFKPAIVLILNAYEQICRGLKLFFRVVIYEVFSFSDLFLRKLENQ